MAMAKCVTCGSELHPERAKKYNYCMSAECQEKNLKGLTMVAVGVNKSAEQYLLLDEQTKAELADGKYHDQRRGTFGRPQPAAAPAAAGPPAAAAGPAEMDPGAAGPGAAGPAVAARSRPAQPGRPPARPASGSPPASAAATRLPGTRSQQRLARLYNQQGLRPDEIAQKLGLSRYAVTQIILAARSQGKI